MTRARTIVVTSILPASAAEIWDRLLLFDTLQFITYPFMTMEPSPESLRVWSRGTDVTMRARLLGIIPLGSHTLHVTQVDGIEYVIESREENELFSAWNHRISLVPISATATRYTDEVEMATRAPWLGGPSRLIGTLYLRHRQRRWRKLLPVAERFRVR